MRVARRVALHLVVALAVAYAIDWSAFQFRRARGGGMGALDVERRLKPPLKGSKNEYDYLGTASQTCARPVPAIWRLGLECSVLVAQTAQDCVGRADPLVRSQPPGWPSGRELLFGRRVQGDPRGPGGPPYFAISAGVGNCLLSQPPARAAIRETDAVMRLLRRFADVHFRVILHIRWGA